MQNRKAALAVAAALAATLLFGCNDKSETAESAPKPAATAAMVETAAAVATVNGMAITDAMIDAQAKRMGSQPGMSELDPAMLREAATDALINHTVLVQQAEKLGFESRPEIKSQIQTRRDGILANALLKEQLATVSFSDAEVQAEYEKHFNTKEQEYKARHILVEAEESAKELITQLDAGGDFAALAKEKSTGPTGANGGDLGWVSPSQMVEPFGNALKAMETGKYSSTPVKTQFGWHVILLEESRDVTPPSLEQVKPQLTELMKRNTLKAYLEDLRTKADVKMN